MKFFVEIALCVMIFSVSQFGCKGSDNQVVPVGPAGPGNLIGHAYLNNENYTLAITDYRGIFFTIDGTADSATTDSTGMWEIQNVKPGTYGFTFSKKGFGTTKVVRYQFAGGGNAYVSNVSLGQLPTFVVSTITTATAGTTVAVSGQISNSVSTYIRYVFLFLGKTSQVNSNPANYFGAFSVEVAPNNNAFTDSTFTSALFLNNYGLVSGDTVHVAAYGYGGSGSSYADSATQRFYYTPLSTTSEETFFKIP